MKLRDAPLLKLRFAVEPWGVDRYDWPPPWKLREDDWKPPRLALLWYRLP